MKIGIGEWKMRNGKKAIIAAHRPGTQFCWIGWIDGHPYPMSWRDNENHLSEDKSAWNIISPWTSPIAAGHNPDKLTEEQVGVSDGWRLLDEDEIGKQIASPERIGSIMVWSGRESWLEKGYGNVTGLTYRTRLSRSELAALDKPKKRLIRVEELPAVCWVDMGNGKRRLANGYDLPEQKLVAGGNHVAILVAKDKGWQWSSDLKNWQSFEVEDKQ